MCENCVWILEEHKHRQLRMFIILLKKKMKEKPKREKPKTVRTPENIAAVAESVCVKRHQHQFTVVPNN